MRSRKKLWLTGSLLAGTAALAASLAIPLASANVKHPAAKTSHCHLKSDQVVDISQFADDLLNVKAQNTKCSVSLTGSYKPGALVAPVMATVKVKPNSDGTPGYTGQIKTKTFTGTVTVNPVCNPCGIPGGKVKVRAGVDFKPPTVYVEVEW